MKVLDLKCSHEHRFEGWFASTEEFESQLSRKLVACPVCSATDVSRMPSAPRLNLSSARGEAAPQATQAQAAPESAALQARALKFMRELIEKTENVGERFAEEARRIHYNEAPARNIRGVTTPEDAHALLEEGIDVMPLPVPEALKEPLQ
ncbi:DUF1178 family protein [Caballeronia novacaledonica]|jgi:hypothetical protein|uniref:DUF1178 family protein n=1 Tax=Caballeronia novacaledonica TaxID=1544861 RepID=A0ACB5QX52_9BURK|nr:MULTISPECIES: DUF1178 family protein [Caballeronia]MBC8641953.1 DUF1178 family protein [Caballeronia sp. EK]GJH12391.1 DUF1178 family protein [Caballeronia novacaledonica]GJH19746.1 DUF1178 family protein [Caballeronia novacaledonica]